MFRRISFPHACLGLALGVAVYAVPMPARSQDLTTQERLDRLERDLSMLQRQVYQGAPTSAVAGGDGNVAVGDEIRLERLETQMRDLTGRVEEYSNQVQQLRQRLEQINSDINVRFQQLGAGGGTASAGSSPPAPPPGDTAGLGDEGGPPPTGPGPGPQTQPIFGTLTPPGEVPVRPPPQFASNTGPAPPAAEVGPLPNASPARQYNYAFGLLKAANYAGAEAALRAFLQQHPRDPMAGSAQYWLGETYYARGKYIEAASTFADGYKRYPRGLKAPEELLKLGMALSLAHQGKNACVAFAQLDRAFPHPGAAIKDRARDEEKRLRCG